MHNIIIGFCLVAFSSFVFSGGFDRKVCDAYKDNDSRRICYKEMGIEELKVIKGEDFIFNYNKSVIKLERSDLWLSGIQRSIEKDGFSIEARDGSKINYLKILMDKDKNVYRIIYSGSGNGSKSSGVDIVYCLLAIVMTIENPNMSVDERGDIIRAMGLTNGVLVEQGESMFERDGVKYSLSLSKSLGLLMIVDI